MARAAPAGPAQPVAGDVRELTSTGRHFSCPAADGDRIHDRASSRVSFTAGPCRSRRRQRVSSCPSVSRGHGCAAPCFPAPPAAGQCASTPCDERSSRKPDRSRLRLQQRISLWRPLSARVRLDTNCLSSWPRRAARRSVGRAFLHPAQTRATNRKDFPVQRDERRRRAVAASLSRFPSLTTASSRLRPWRAPLRQEPIVMPGLRALGIRNWRSERRRTCGTPS